MSKLMPEYNQPSVGHPYPLEYQPFAPAFRDQLDARRSMWRRTPDAEYPSGYLGTITSRRGDRLLDSLKNRINKRAYDRGVHKGERIDHADYFWTEWFHPMMGLKRQASTGLRHAPLGTYVERALVNDGKVMPRGSESLILLDPERQRRLGPLSPRWR